ncbi:hypothetical protein D3C81_376400 [compost metagenome]
MSTFVIEAIVQGTSHPRMAKYLQIFQETHEVNLLVRGSGKLLFSRSLNDAYFFNNIDDAKNLFNELIDKLTEPNTGGRTMFASPMAELVGGVFGHRSYNIEFSLVALLGDSLAHGEVRVITKTEINAEERVGAPYVITAVNKVKLMIPPDNKLGDYDITPPTMQEGDIYESSKIDYAANRVIHTARAMDEKRAYYICTAQGNLLHRQLIYPMHP